VDFRPEISLRTKGDIVFRRQRLVVFVDGCFWHSCPLHGTVPRNNRDWWIDKLNANRERDSRNRASLEGLGWRCLAFWAHDDPSNIVTTIVAALGVEDGERRG
jgi:DNA mismatch endonuclease (patch repair protein)